MPGDHEPPFDPPATGGRTRSAADDRRVAGQALLVAVIVFWFAGFASCATLNGRSAIIAWIVCQAVGMGASGVAIFHAIRGHATALGVFAVLHLLVQGLVASITDVLMGTY